MTPMSPYDDDLKELGECIGKECDASDDNIRELSLRWEALEKMVRNQPGSSGQQGLLENYTPFVVPLMGPLLKRIVTTTHRQFIRAEPMILAVAEDGNTDGAKAVEVLLEAVFRKAGVDYEGMKTLETASVHGKGVFRFWPSADGFKMEPIHSKHVTVYPEWAASVDEVKTIGHKYYLRADQVLAMMELKNPDGSDHVDQWMKCDIAPINDDPKKDEAGRDRVYDLQSRAPIIVEDTDKGVEIRELFTYREFKGKKGWMRVQFVKSVNAIVHIEPFKGRPWYFDQALHYEYGSFWTSSSLANQLQGLQHLYTDLHNLLIVGSFAAAFPPIVLTGGSLGEKKWKYSLASVWELPGNVQFSSIPIQFNPGVIPEMIQQVEKVAQSVAATTAAGQGKQFSSHTTKAEVDLLAATQSNADEGYLMTAGQAYAFVGDFVLQWLRDNPEYAKEHYGHALSDGWDTAKVRLEPTGRTVGDMPEAVIQKIGTAGQIIGQFGLQQKYDIQALGESALTYVGLPFPLDKFRRQAPSMGGGPQGLGGAPTEVPGGPVQPGPPQPTGPGIPGAGPA